MVHYIAEYSRPGDYHNQSPTVVFQAENDDIARTLALAYIAKTKSMIDGDFCLMHLTRFRFSVEGISFEDDGSEIRIGDKDLGALVDGIRFVPLKDAIVPR